MSGLFTAASVIIYKPGEGVLLARRASSKRTFENTLALPSTYLRDSRGGHIEEYPRDEDEARTLVKEQLPPAVQRNLLESSAYIIFNE